MTPITTDRSDPRRPVAEPPRDASGHRSTVAALGFILAVAPLPRLAAAQPPPAPVVRGAGSTEPGAAPFAANDVGRFMEEVFQNRNAAWQRLAPFSLREHSTVEIEMPWKFPRSRFRRDHEYEWRVGEVAVRLPLERGGAVGERERVTAERAWLRQARDRREGRERRLAEEGGRVDCLLPGTTAQPEPKFIEDFYYFAEFTCAPGRFYLVGWERVAGREVVRIEYHPEEVDDEDAEFAERLYDGVRRTSLITFWVDVEARQIVKYTVVSRDFDFLPARWLVRVEGVEATMEMAPAGDGWLPRRMTLSGRGGTALGGFHARFVSEFSGYRHAETGTQPSRGGLGISR